jgi:hypothetical protein
VNEDHERDSGELRKTTALFRHHLDLREKPKGEAMSEGQLLIHELGESPGGSCHSLQCLHSEVLWLAQMKK